MRIDKYGIHFPVSGGEKTAPLPERIELTEDGALPEGVELTEAEQTAALAYEPPAPPVPVPDTITRRQFHMVAYSMFGLTEEFILSQINAIPDDTQRTLALIDYKQASAFRWDWPLLVAMADGIGITEAERKQAWIAGAQIL